MKNLKFANSPIVETLPEYVEEHTGLLVDAYMNASKTFESLTHQADVKGKAALNILTTDIAFGDGSECGWEENSTQTLTQREIETKTLKVDIAYCERKLIGKWAEYAIKIDANAGNRGLPFEEEFMQGVTSAVAESLDKALWQGDEATGLTGMEDILLNTDDVITVEAGDTLFATVSALVQALPSKAIKGDTVVFCAPATLLAYTQELVEKNLYHFAPEASVDEVTIPGTAIRLVAVEGLTDASVKFVAARKSNLFVGFDLADAYKSYDLWYSKDAREFRLEILFNVGVQVAFPNQVAIVAEA